MCAGAILSVKKLSNAFYPRCKRNTQITKCVHRYQIPSVSKPVFSSTKSGCSLFRKLNRFMARQEGSSCHYSKPIVLGHDGGLTGFKSVRTDKCIMYAAFRPPGWLREEKGEKSSTNGDYFRNARSFVSIWNDVLRYTLRSRLNDSAWKCFAGEEFESRTMKLTFCNL